MLQDWRRVEELFLAAADMPEASQAAFLDRECAGHEELRREVASLLRYDRSGTISIPEALEEAATSLLAQDPHLGERLGAYRIVREIGAGGMATVYLAVRDDEQYEKRVAVKLVKAGISPGPLLERFRYERQILANLDHPYITRLLDGGTTEGGLPYFVMEYVEGVPIDAYCEEHQLDVEQRCELFCKVCEAVGYAHRNLVIHRDLKPGNLLVTPEGTPKLLDFGIAKLLTPDGSQTLYGTAGELIWALTPDYASPEQVRGEPVTTATDVYSLGALLYRLLSGAKPHVIQAYTPHEVERVVCREEPKKLSSVAVKDAFRKRLAGDLDNIVLMAMRKEPERRYGSVDQLGEDVRRHLAGLPVVAREDNLGYRAGKFVRRYRIVVAAAGAALLSMAIGSAGAVWQAHQASGARRIAELAREQAEAQTREAERQQTAASVERDRAIRAGALAETKAREAEQARALAEQRLGQLVELSNRSVFDIQGAIERLSGATEVRRQIANTTLEFLDGLARDAGGDPRVLRVLAQAYARLGDVQGLPTKASLGNTTGALESYQKAHAILRQLTSRAPADSELAVRMAALHYRIGMTLAATSRTKEGLDWYERGLAITRECLRKRPADTAAAEQAALLELALARSYLQTDLTRAVVFARAQLESYRKLAQARPDDDRTAQALSSAYSMAGAVAAMTGNVEQGLEYARQCAAIREKLAEGRPHDVDLQRDLMLAYGHIGDRLGNPLVPNLGNPAAAKTSYEKARKIVEAMVAADPSNRMAQKDLGTVLLRLGVVTVTTRERDESLALLRSAARIVADQLRAEPRNTSLQSDLATVYEYIGIRLLEAGTYEEALENFRQDLAISERQAAEDPRYSTARHQIMAAYKGLAMVRARQGDRNGALEQIKVAIETGDRLAKEGPNPRGMQKYPAMVQGWLGSVYETVAEAGATPLTRLADWKQARDAYARGKTLWNQVEPSFRSWNKAEIGRVAERLKACEEQVRMLEAALP